MAHLDPVLLHDHGIALVVADLFAAGLGGAALPASAVLRLAVFFGLAGCFRLQFGELGKQRALLLQQEDHGGAEIGAVAIGATQPLFH